jgi:hypothetical protein
MTTDRLTLAHVIEDAGIERSKAERVASAIFDAISDNVATKQDIARLEAATRQDIAAVNARLDQVGAALKADIVAVRADLALVEHRLLTRLGGLIVVLAGLLFAALRYWPPGHG